MNGIFHPLTRLVASSHGSYGYQEGLQLHFSAFLFLQYRDVLFLTLSNPFSSILQSLHINFHKLEFPRFTILHFQFGVADLFPSSEFNYVQW